MTIEQPSPPRHGGLSQVTVTINGRRFRMACEDGQQTYLCRLAGDLDQRIGRLRDSFGEIGNTRLTLMAALILSDELVEMGDRLRALEREVAALNDARAAAAEHSRVTQAAVAAALNAAAERIEGIARRLNYSRPPDAGARADPPEPDNVASDTGMIDKVVPSMVAAGRRND